MEAQCMTASGGDAREHTDSRQKDKNQPPGQPAPPVNGRRAPGLPAAPKREALMVTRVSQSQS